MRQALAGTGIIMKSSMKGQSQRLPKLCFVAGALATMLLVSSTGRAQQDWQSGTQIHEESVADRRAPTQRAPVADARDSSQISRLDGTLNETERTGLGQRINSNAIAAMFGNLKATPGIPSMEPGTMSPMN